MRSTAMLLGLYQYVFIRLQLQLQSNHATRIIFRKKTQEATRFNQNIPHLIAVIIHSARQRFCVLGFCGTCATRSHDITHQAYPVHDITHQVYPVVGGVPGTYVPVCGTVWTLCRSCVQDLRTLDFGTASHYFDAGIPCCCNLPPRAEEQKTLLLSLRRFFIERSCCQVFPLNQHNLHNYSPLFLR